MFKWVNGLLDRMCAVAGAIVLMQAPLFIHQYMQQLSGHTEELRVQAQAMQRAASASGKTLEQYIYKFIENGDLDFVNQGNIMLALVTRWHQFSEAMTSLQNSTVISRPFIFISHLNWDIAKSTWHNFSFGLPLNLEGFVYAMAGLVAGFIFYSLIHRLCLAIWRMPFTSPSSCLCFGFLGKLFTPLPFIHSGL